MALLLTDAATDEFAEINITITRAELISETLKTTILSTTKTVDLLELQRVYPKLPGGLSFDPYNPATTTTECVTLDAAAKIFLISTTPTSYDSTEITPAELVDTQSLQVFGDFAPSGCFTAHTVLASPI